MYYSTVTKYTDNCKTFKMKNNRKYFYFNQLYLNTCIRNIRYKNVKEYGNIYNLNHTIFPRGTFLVLPYHFT